MTLLLPRLPTLAALEIAESLLHLSPPAASAKVSTDPHDPRVRFAPTGGIRASPKNMEDLRAGLLQAAQAAGFPGARRLDGQRHFDTECARLLFDFVEAEGEAGHREVWQYISCVLAPDLVCWRWAGRDGVAEERFLGGKRNCFGRLWLRAVTFHDSRLPDPWTLLTDGDLGEDQIQALLERPTFARVRPLCREMARAFLLRLPAVQGLGIDNPPQTLLRQAMLRMTRLGAHVFLPSLDAAGRAGICAEVLDGTIGALGGRAIPVEELERLRPALRIELDEESEGETPGLIRSEADFHTMSQDERAATINRLMYEAGALPEEDFIREAAFRLKAAGFVEFERFRANGVLASGIRGAVEHGRSMDLFTIPRRGFRQAQAPVSQKRRA